MSRYGNARSDWQKFYTFSKYELATMRQAELGQHKIGSDTKRSDMAKLRSKALRQARQTKQTANLACITMTAEERESAYV